MGYYIFCGIYLLVVLLTCWVLCKDKNNKK